MYMLFSGDNYYPSGGWDDYKGTFSSEKEALEHFAKGNDDWMHIVFKGQIVYHLTKTELEREAND